MQESVGLLNGILGLKRAYRSRMHSTIPLKYGSHPKIEVQNVFCKCASGKLSGKDLDIGQQGQPRAQLSNIFRSIAVEEDAHVSG